jgi:hypothetical protein
MAADWDKAAEQIAQIHALQDECLAMLREMRAELQAINERPLPELGTALAGPMAGLTVPPLLDRLHGIERRLGRLENDLTRLEIGQIERGTRVLQLDGHLRELEQRLRKVEQRLDEMERRREQEP